MEPEGSLPHLQEPTTCPYSEPDQSSPSPTPLPENPIYYTPICAWVLHLRYVTFSDHVLLVPSD